MIVSIALFKLLIAILISLAAWMLERTASAVGAPRRWIWIAAIVLSWSIPNLTLTQQHSEQRPGAAAHMAVGSPAASVENPGQTVIGRLRTAYQQALPLAPELDTLLQRIIAGASLGAVLFFGLVWMRLIRLARRWTPAVLDDTPVLLTDDLGPAVVGFIRPRIVMPRWLIELPQPVRAWILKHERAHISARDPLLLLAAMIFVLLAGAGPNFLAVLWQFWRLRFAIEVDCDARVLGKTPTSRDYGAALFAVAQRRVEAPAGAIPLAARASDLERRIAIMISGGAGANWPTAAGCGLGAIALIYLAGVTDAPLAPYPRLVQWIHTHKEIVLDEKTLDAFAGYYELRNPYDPNARERVRLSVEDNRLLVDAAPVIADLTPLDLKPRDAFAPESQRDFLLVTPPRRSVRLTFDVDRDGRPTDLIENDHGKKLRFKRVADAR